MSVLASYQQALSHRQYVAEPMLATAQLNEKVSSSSHGEEEVTLPQERETLWLHDAETLAWIKKWQQKGVE